jgi:hypothetical protein
MTRYYFYTADLYYYDPAGGSAPARLGDYQGVYEIEDDSLTPTQVFTNLLEELKKTVPADLGTNAYYHVTQFNNVT